MDTTKAQQQQQRVNTQLADALQAALQSKTQNNNQNNPTQSKSTK